MKRINTRFSIVGTNPFKYFENYMDFLNTYEIGEEFKLDRKDWKILKDQTVVFSAHSDATFRQNYTAWLGMGFFILKNNSLIKIVPKTTSATLIEYIKISLLLPNHEENINTYRNTIITKLLATNDANFMINKNVFTKRGELTYEEIKKETGKFEKMLAQDPSFIDILKVIGGSDEQ